MTTETIPLSSFLLARLEDDEEAAKAATAGPWMTRHGFPAYVSGPSVGVTINAVTADMEQTDAVHIARHDPARVLAECAAKRAIVELHAAYPTLQVMVYGTITACSECGSVDDSPVEWPCPTLRTLAAVYSSHPDYREGWKP